MSLFGSSPDDSSLIDQAPRSKQNPLFNDKQTSETVSSSSLFDDDGSGGPSPWSLPTPKKADRSDVVKSLLETTDVPESYVDTYDILLESGYKTVSGTISLSGSRKLFESSGLGEAEQARILSLVAGGQEIRDGLGRREFNVLLALVGLSQEKEEATLDGVDERRKSF